MIAILPAGAQTIVVSRLPNASSATLGWWNSVNGNPQAVSWTQAANTQFSSVVISGLFCTDTLVPATGTAYLSTSLGAGATPIASASISTAVTCQTLTAATLSPALYTTLNFGGVNLPTGPSGTTYYLTVYDAGSNLGWVFENNPQPTSICGTTSSAACPNGGVSVNTDQYSDSANTANPPASTFTAFGSPNQGILFTVTGNTGIPTATVPTLTPWGLGGAALLLLAAGLFLVRRQNPA